MATYRLTRVLLSLYVPLGCQFMVVLQPNRYLSSKHRQLGMLRYSPVCMRLTSNAMLLLTSNHIVGFWSPNAVDESDSGRNALVYMQLKRG